MTGRTVQDCPRLWRMLRETDPSWIKNQKTSKLRFKRLLEKLKKMIH